MIAATGRAKKELLGKRISSALEALMEARVSFPGDGEQTAPRVSDESEETAAVMFPILGGGDVMGAVLLLQSDDAAPTDTEIKLMQVAAGFLGKQMEE